MISATLQDRQRSLLSGGASPLTPDFARGVDDEAELGLFLFDRQRVAVDGRREAALRAEAELIERLEFRHLVDPALQPTFSQVPVVGPRSRLGESWATGYRTLGPRKAIEPIS